MSTITAGISPGLAATCSAGTAQPVTVLELLDAVRTVTGCAVPAEHVAAKPGEMPAVIVDISRAREHLGYRPSVSLVDGLATVWQDFATAGSPLNATVDRAPVTPGAGGPGRCW
jgi:UDP-glucose 4-epimerase